MIMKRLMAVAVAAVFIAGAATDSAYAGPKNDNRKKIEEENKRLQEKIDSLQMEL